MSSKHSLLLSTISAPCIAPYAVSYVSNQFDNDMPLPRLLAFGEFSLVRIEYAYESKELMITSIQASSWKFFNI